MFTTVMPAGVQIIDGGTSEAEVDYVAVGYSEGDNGVVGPAVSMEAAVSDEALREAFETYDVLCETSSWTGDDNPSAARKRVFELYDLANAAVSADPRLGDTVMLTRVSAGNLIQGLSGEGSVASLSFTVHVQASVTA